MLLAPVAYGAGIDHVLEFQGVDSGWTATVEAGASIGIVVRSVDLGDDPYVRIQIDKGFFDPPEGGVFAANRVHFWQHLDDAYTVSRIEIDDEAIYNFTGADWTGYHWEIVGAGAAFDKTATEDSGFSQANPSSIDPFTIMTWGPAQTGWDVGHPASLDLSGGVVGGDVVDPDWLPFWPAMEAGEGMLIIDVDLSLPKPDSDFLLVQYPTPEPGTMALLALGACALLGRARRNKPDRGGRSRA